MIGSSSGTSRAENEHSNPARTNLAAVRAEIELIEQRLENLGDGDCAYEKAMARFYEDLLAARRASIAAAD